MNRAAIYCRVSTEEQANEGYSIQAQLQELHQYARLRDMTVVEEFIDEGASGKSINGRPEMIKLLNDSTKNKFDTVLVYKLDRLARKLKDALEISEVLENNNITLVVLKENFDASTPVGKMIFQVLGSVAEMERSTIVDRVKMGMTQRAREGYYNGGSCFGYDNQNKELIINELEAAIIREIFTLAEQGLGNKAITNRINTAGYRTKRGQLFGTGTVKQILDNPIYIGIIRFNQHENWSDKRRKGKNPDPLTVPGKHQPIIEKEQWDRVQELRKERSHKPARSCEPYILSGLMKCPQCGYGMVPGRSKGKNGTSHRYYVCSQHHNKGKTACSANSVRADQAEADVLAQLALAATHPDMLRDIVARLNQKRNGIQQEYQTKMNMVKGQLNSINKKIDRLLDELAEGNISKSILVPKIEQLEVQQKALQLQLSELETMVSEPSTTPIDPEALRNLLLDFTRVLEVADPEQQKALLRMAIREITVTPNNPRRVTNVILHFDLTLPLAGDSFELLKSLYPGLNDNWFKLSKKTAQLKRLTADSDFYPVLPLTMIRFAFQYLPPPVELFGKD